MRKILIVDDEPLMHVLYKKHLERAGFELLTARDGVEAMAVVERTTPDLIVMDMMMPGMDGIATIRELRQNKATQAVPIIVITANVSVYTTSGKEARLGGADALLTKPLSPARLVAEVQRFFPAEQREPETPSCVPRPAFA